MNLTDRLRGIVSADRRPGHVPLQHESSPQSPRDARPEQARTQAALAGSLESVLGGSWCSGPGGRCFIVERTMEAQVGYGGMSVGDIAESITRGTAHAATLTAGAAPGPFMFFDLETTGLSGGAGTHAFLVGCGSFSATGAFVTKQYLLVKYAEERPMLQSVAATMRDAGAIVTFNGKSFDAPVLETRYLFHRLEWQGRSLPHIDVLHPARRFWGGAGPQTRDGEAGCSLIALERQILGLRREGDVPGFEVPLRYFRFVRSGDPAPLAAVLEHNRLDLLSLAGLCARLLHLVAGGADATANAQEALALGRLYTRAGRDSDARSAYQKAVVMAGSRRSDLAVRLEGLRRLAVTDRRGRRYAEAEERWRQLLETPGCPPSMAREALEALAVHHEHRARDLEAARAFAVRTLEAGTSKGKVEKVRYRIARIDQKLAASATARVLWNW